MESKNLSGPGTISFENLSPGTYRLSETIHSLDYETSLSDLGQIVEVKAGETTTVNVTNTCKYGSIKIDKNYQVPEGVETDDLQAEFKLYTKMRNIYLEIPGSAVTITGAGSAVSQKLYPGDYYLKETKIPDGYTSDYADYIKITVAKGQTTPVTVKNTCNKGVIRIEKTYEGAAEEGSPKRP